MTNIKAAVFIIIFGLILMFSLSLGLKRSERAECLKWKQWNEQGYTKFKITPAIHAQCDQYVKF